jgi:REP element-mobilizing transposase RayT
MTPQALSNPASPERPPRRPWAYFLTTACYGAHLHGHSEGSADRSQRGPRVEPSKNLEQYGLASLKEPPFLMDAPRRSAVLQAMLGVCEYQGWTLHAAHVRANHFHVVVTAEEKPEVVVGKLKAYASRALNEKFGRRTRYWTRQGNTRWLWSHEAVNEAVEYVAKQQGEPMALYENPDRWRDYLRAPE